MEGARDADAAWLEGELDRTRLRAKVVHRDSLQVRREGAAQIALVGPPNAGKSSLLQALSDIQIKTGDYAFTTLRPVPALTRIGGVLVQLVEIPGLIEGAHEDRGGGRALLGVLRNADAIVYCRAAGEPPAALDVVLREVAAAGIEKPAMPMPHRTFAEGAKRRLVGKEGSERVATIRALLGELPGYRNGPYDHDVGRACTGGRVWGPSARFGGQRVGRAHVLADGDVVEALVR